MNHTKIYVALLLLACTDPNSEGDGDDSGTGGAIAPAGGTRASGGSSGSSGSSAGGRGGSSGSKGGSGPASGGKSEGGAAGADDSPGGGGQGGEGDGPVPPDTGWPDPTACVADSDLPIVGVWEGALLDFYFNPVVPLRVEILGASEAGGVCGIVHWGDGPPPPPVTDPNRGYPPFDDMGGGGKGMQGGLEPSSGLYIDGESYTILNGAVRNNRVHFGLSAGELWREWCSVQTSYPQTSYPPPYQWFNCVPPGGNYFDDTGCHVTDELTGEMYDFDAHKCFLCVPSTCICNADSCAADPSNNRTPFEIIFEGDQATGTAQYVIEGTDISLTRVE